MVEYIWFLDINFVLEYKNEVILSEIIILFYLLVIIVLYLFYVLKDGSVKKNKM